VAGVPYLFKPGFSFSQVNAGGTGALLLVSLLISHTSGVRRKTEERLKKINAELDQRVQERTAELERLTADLESSRDLLRATLASIGDAVISTDAQGRVVFANPIALQLLRCTESAVAGRHLNEVFRVINESTRAPVESPLSKVLNEGAIVGLANHTVLIAQDGTEIPIDDSGAPIRSLDGTIQGAVVVFRDVTARRRAEATSRLLASIVENSDDAIISKDLSGIVTSWNEGAERLFGYSAAEMIGRSVSILAEPSRAEEMPEILERIRRGEHVDHYATVRKTKNGKLLTMSLSVSPILDAMGRVIGASKIARDVSETVRGAERLKQLNADLEAANVDLKRLNHDLQRFSFVASHDLQEPLRMITAYSQLLIRSHPAPLDSRAETCVGYIVEGTNRMRELLADLLTYTELGTQNDEPPNAVDLDLLLENVRENLRISIQEAGAVVTSDSLPVIYGHRAHYLSLFQNLIGNAIKYRGENPPRIHMSVERRDDAVRFAVTDNGMGIAPEYHRQIFEIFKRLHGNKIPGTGVGLAICERLVERYGGRIGVESEAGKGASFWFTLPSALLRVSGDRRHERTLA
jgi:PAS domain S-box-containing protein